MRAAFPEHFVGEPERQQKLWAECIFVLDTNVLLDLYRFSDSAREALFKVMESLGKRLWIPHQVAAEYFENRLSVIEAQSDAYAKSISGLKLAKEKFNAGARHPFVSDDVFDKFISSYDLMIEELEGKQKNYHSFVVEDSIKTRIADILNGRIGKSYTADELDRVALEGEQRYAESVPPGFQDGGKMPEAASIRMRMKKFGDLILWKQLIDQALASNKSVILVTGEKKDDWWLKSEKRLVSALPALSKEFMDSVGQDFYLYATDRFLLKANEYLKQDTSDNVVEEVRAINKADEERTESLGSGHLSKALGFVWADESHVLDKWASKNVRDLLALDEAEFVLESTRQSVSEQKEIVLQRARSTKNQLDLYLDERERARATRQALISTGVLSNDDKLTSIERGIDKLDVVIESYWEELSLLRKQMRTLSAHQRGLSDSEG